MDIPSSPVLAELVLKLRDTYQVQNFLETGTYLGVTARWASQYFKQVFTIEASQFLWEQAVRNHAEISNIEFLHGDSRLRLTELLPCLLLPPIIWLDAHWSAGITFGETDQCPLMGELQILQGIMDNAFIFIDDADLFLSPPPRPNSLAAWPDIYTVMRALKQTGAENYVLVFENALISVPAYARSFVATYCQEINTRRFDQKVQAERSLLNRTFYRLRRKLENSIPALKSKI